MDATCTIQDSIHVFNLVHKYVSRILGTYQFSRVQVFCLYPATRQPWFLFFLHIVRLCFIVRFCLCGTGVPSVCILCICALCIRILCIRILCIHILRIRVFCIRILCICCMQQYALIMCIQVFFRQVWLEASEHNVRPQISNRAESDQHIYNNGNNNVIVEAPSDHQIRQQHQKCHREILDT